jgi:hypothetical protein
LLADELQGRFAFTFTGPDPPGRELGRYTHSLTENTCNRAASRCWYASLRRLRNLFDSLLVVSAEDGSEPAAVQRERTLCAGTEFLELTSFLADLQCASFALLSDSFSRRSFSSR